VLSALQNIKALDKEFSERFEKAVRPA